MDVSVFERRWFSVPQHDDQNVQLNREGANLDLTCQRPTSVTSSDQFTNIVCRLVVARLSCSLWDLRDSLYDIPLTSFFFEAGAWTDHERSAPNHPWT